MAELTECLVSVQEWMNGVKLKLNPGKTEFIIIGYKHTTESLIPKFPVEFLQTSRMLAEEVQNSLQVQLKGQRDNLRSHFSCKKYTEPTKCCRM